MNPSKDEHSVMLKHSWAKIMLQIQLTKIKRQVLENVIGFSHIIYCCKSVYICKYLNLESFFCGIKFLWKDSK